MTEIKPLTEQLPKEIMPAMRLSNVLSTLAFLVVFGILLVLHYYFSWYFWIGWILMGLIVFTLLMSIWELGFAPYLTYKNTRYALDEEYFQFKTGRLKQSHNIFPMKKIQSVETNQGPILRKYGLTAVYIHTLGSGCHIRGLPTETAIQFRNKLAELANIEDGDRL